MASATQIDFFAMQNFDDFATLKKLEAGLPISMFHDFIDASGLPASAVHQIVIPLRTLKHRRARNENFTIDESDKLTRLMRLYKQTIEVFGNQEKASQWLTDASDFFEGRTPLQLLQTELGGRRVEDSLWQIADGMFV